MHADTHTHTASELIRVSGAGSRPVGLMDHVVLIHSKERRERHRRDRGERDTGEREGQKRETGEREERERQEERETGGERERGEEIGRASCRERV